MADDATRVDMWSGLDHMVGMGDTAGELDAAPPYLDEEQKRRINAYARLRAIIETVRRLYLADDNDDLPDEWREYGDAQVYVSRVAAAVLGNGSFISVDGADSPQRDRPDIDAAPSEPDADLPDAERAIRQREYEIRLARWIEQSTAELDRWEAELTARPSLDARQDWLENWAVDERALAKIKQIEKEFVVPFGTGVLELHWDSEHNRVGMEIHSPEGYFPVLDDSAVGEFPTKVHLAWIFEEADADGELVEYVRRITYELVPVEGDDADPALAGSRPAYLAPDDQWLWSCVYSNGVWRLDDFERLDMTSRARWELIDDPAGGETPVAADQVPLNLDFIPLIEVTNTDNDAEHFGRPLLVRVVQLLDEIAGTDRDDALASRRAADPPFALSGMEPGTTEVDLGPGRGVNLGDNGSMTYMDVSSGQERIAARILALLRRLSVNLGVPEGLVGRVDASDVPSGIAFTLSFTAFEQLIEDLRLARDHKYSLLLKMVQRMAINNGDDTVIDPDRVYPAHIKFGSFMPQDLLGVAQVIKILVEARVISQETAIAWLRESGVPSDDQAAELESIRGSYMADEADRIAEALGDSRYAADFLGIEGFGRTNGNQPAAGIDATGPLPDQGGAIQL